MKVVFVRGGSHRYLSVARSILYDAFYNYPIQRDTATSKKMWTTLLEINDKELPSEFQETKKLLRN